VYNRDVPITMREFGTGDFDRLYELDQKCFPPGIAYSRLELMHYIRRQSAFTIIAEVDAEIAGFTIGEHWHSKGHVITLDVGETFRRLGIGSKLMVECEDRFRKAGCGVSLLETAVNNGAAIAFYKRHGYVVVKTIPRYYEGLLDALLMGKKLNVNAMSANER
jgi:[ribosomal protein S18]-alanine N-acetyltransferase